jgi:hypothetical protein
VNGKSNCLVSSVMTRNFDVKIYIRKDFENPENGRFEKSVEGLLYAMDNGQRKLAVSQGKLRQALMHAAHDALVSGHFGCNKAYERLRQGVT